MSDLNDLSQEVYKKYNLSELNGLKSSQSEKTSIKDLEIAPKLSNISNNKNSVLDNKNSIYKFLNNLFPKFQNIEIRGETINVQVSMSHFSKSQLSTFIDECVTWARQEGFDVPDPEDLKALQMYNFYKMKGLI